LDELRRESLTITHAVSAAGILAIQQLYGRDGETGAAVSIARHARRWVDTRRAPFAIDSVPLWIPLDHHSLQNESSREIMLGVSRYIKTELRPHLESPHYLGAMEHVLRPKLAAVMASSKDCRTSKSFSLSVSSQGIIHVEPEFKSEDSIIRTHGYQTAGRSTDARLMITVNTFRGQLRLHCAYHTSIFARDTMEEYAAQLKLNLASICSPLHGEIIHDSLV
jgi:hypothetical protein